MSIAPLSTLSRPLRKVRKSWRLPESSTRATSRWSRTHSRMKTWRWNAAGRREGPRAGSWLYTGPMIAVLQLLLHAPKIGKAVFVALYGYQMEAGFMGGRLTMPVLFGEVLRRESGWYIGPAVPEPE